MRGNKPTAKEKVVKARFIEAMKAKGVTIKSLGEMSLEASYYSFSKHIQKKQVNVL